ncbi:MAG TPA: hypothetical protein VFU36_15925 [Jatrophihabitans sp.]|nr:hypothetical protein [Jatrophihabitans sp.]
MTTDTRPAIDRAITRPARWRRLNPATVVVWRAPDVVQLELGDRRVTVSNVRPEHMSALMPLRGGHWPGEPAPAPESSLSDREERCSPGTSTDDRLPDRRARSRPRPLHGEALELAEELHRAGFLTRPIARRMPPARLPAYLNADLDALLGRYGDEGPAVMARRRRSAVAVHGTSRITTTLAATLAGAGIGQVQLVDGGDVAAADSCPGGLSYADEGSRFRISGVAAIRRSSPDVVTAPIGAGRFADLVILTDPVPVEPAIRDSLHLDGLAHLSVAVHGSRAVIGPLVIPGRSSCLRCADLHRSERDPCWPALAVQLAARAKHRAISEVALCVATAGLAAGQALSYIDGQRPETIGGTVEWQLPEWRLRRRSWPPHQECDCGAALNPIEDGRMGL